jgi:hypothetical protein
MPLGACTPLEARKWLQCRTPKDSAKYRYVDLMMMKMMMMELSHMMEY